MLRGTPRRREARASWAVGSGEIVQVAENALGETGGETGHGRQLRCAGRADAGHAPEALQQTTPLGRPDARDVQRPGSAAPLGPSLRVVRQAEAVGFAPGRLPQPEPPAPAGEAQAVR